MQYDSDDDALWSHEWEPSVILSGTTNASSSPTDNEDQTGRNAWRCVGCNNTSPCSLERNADMSMVCPQCGAVNAAEMRSIHRDRACSEHEDGTTRADRWQALEETNEVVFETAEETRRRRQNGSTVSLAAKRRMGLSQADALVQSTVARRMREESALGKDGERKFKDLLKALTVCMLKTQPVHVEVEKHARLFLQSIVRKSVVHCASCEARASSCELDVCNHRSDLVAMYAYRAALDGLQRRHGTSAWTLSADVSLEGIRRVAVAASALDVPHPSDQAKAKAKQLVHVIASISEEQVHVSCAAQHTAKSLSRVAETDESSRSFLAGIDAPSQASEVDRMGSIRSVASGLATCWCLSPSTLDRARRILSDKEVAASMRADSLSVDALALISVRIAASAAGDGAQAAIIERKTREVCDRSQLSHELLQSRVPFYDRLVASIESSFSLGQSEEADDDAIFAL